jgi:hypothetical protein
MMTAFEVEIPSLRILGRHAVPRLIEGTIVPLALFLVFLHVLGVWGAMVAGLVWMYAAIFVRLALRRRVPGVLVLGAITLTARTLVYFLQPSLGTILVGAAFLLSVPLDRPLADKLAADFCPLSREVRGNRHVRRFFRRVSLLWAAAQMTNATLTIWLLFSQSVGTFVVLRSVVSAAVTVTGIAVSTIWFRRSMSRHGIVVRMGARRAPSPA